MCCSMSLRRRGGSGRSTPRAGEARSVVWESAVFAAVLLSRSPWVGLVHVLTACLGLRAALPVAPPPGQHLRARLHPISAPPTRPPRPMRHHRSRPHSVFAPISACCSSSARCGRRCERWWACRQASCLGAAWWACRRPAFESTSASRRWLH
jgi:hypothetical protein